MYRESGSPVHNVFLGNRNDPHGTTGVDEEQIKMAINAGIRKFNYFTGIGTSATESIEKQIKEATSPLYYHQIATNAKEIMKERSKHIIEVFMNK